MALNNSNTPLTHVLVADGGTARLMRMAGPRKRRTLEQVELFERASAHVPARSLITDHSGRVFESSGRGHTNPGRVRHGAAGDYDPHEVEIERFVARIAQHLESRHRAGELSTLVLIAEPRLLGVLRARLPAELRRLVSYDIAGDYIHADNKQLLGLMEAKEQP